MYTQYNDCRGTPINVGDTVAVAMRHSSSAWIQYYYVVEFEKGGNARPRLEHPTTLKVHTFGGSPSAIIRIG